MGIVPYPIRWQYEGVVVGAASLQATLNSGEGGSVERKGESDWDGDSVASLVAVHDGVRSSGWSV